MPITLVPELIRQFVGAATKLTKGVSPFQRCSSRKEYHQTKKQSGYQRCYVFASKMTGLDADIVRASLRIAIDNINQNR